MGLSVGFTGTRHGMTEEQAQVVAALIHALAPTEAHHGDCVGADAEFDKLCEKLGVPQIIAHPPNTWGLRAFTRPTSIRQKHYLARNADIVRACDVLIATPHEMTEQPRGGTWHTIREARRAWKPRIIVRPDGSMRGKGRVNGRALRDIAGALQG